MRKASLALLLAGGCVVHERLPPRYDPPPPPAEPPPAPAPAPQPPPAPARPPAPAPRAVEERQAVKAATDFARAKGLQVERFKARLDRHGNWRVDLRSDHGGDRAKVLVDGRTGRVLRAKLHDSDDWDD